MNFLTLENNAFLLHTTITTTTLIHYYNYLGDLFALTYDRRSTRHIITNLGPVPRSMR